MLYGGAGMQVKQRNQPGPAVAGLHPSYPVSSSLVKPNVRSNQMDSSRLSSNFGSVSRVLAADGSTHASRVEQVALQYQSGEYAVDPQALSRGMISEALQCAGL